MINDPWSLICAISLWAWIGAAIGFIMRSFPSRGVFDSRSAVVWGGIMVFFYTLWIVGMLKV